MVTLSIFQWHNCVLQLLPVQAQAIHYNRNRATSHCRTCNHWIQKHTAHASLFLNFDLLTGKKIHLKDLFKEGYEQELTRLLLAELEKQNKVTTESELEDIGYFITEPLSPTENFYLNEDGLSFFYNVYEIAPYVMGTTEIKVPFSAIESLLKEGNPAEELE